MRYFLAVAAMMLLFSTSRGQHPDWMNYTNGKEVLCMMNDGNYMWIGTSGGLVKMEKSTGNCVYFTKTNSGLPGNQVKAIDKDSQGNLWLCSMGAGVSKFDGVNWTSYNEYLSPTQPFNFTSAIFCHPDGSVWVGASAGTAGGVYRFFNNTWTFYGNSITSLHGWIESIIADTAGIVYIASEGNGITRYDGATWTNYTPQNSALLNDGIHDLALDSQNNIWASSYNCGGLGGLSKFDGTTWTTHLLYTNIEKIDIDAIGNIWFNEYPFGISKYNGSTLVTFDSTNSQITDVSEEILVDGTDIWYATAYQNGLKKFDGISQVTSYNTSQTAITFNHNNTLAVDTNGVVWIPSALSWLGSGPKGIDRLDQNGFTNLNMNNSGLPVPYVTCISVDPSNQLWMGSADGVIRYDGNTFTHFDSASYNLIGSVIYHEPVFDDNGNVYCLFKTVYDSSGAQVGGGIMKYDGNSWTKINLSAIADPWINYIAIDNQNNLWAAGFEIIEKHSLSNPVVFNSINTPQLLNANFTSLLADGNNNMWISTYNGAFFKIQNSQNFTTYNITSCILMPGFSDFITSMAIDKDNNLWFETLDFCSENGMLLAKFDGSAFTYFNVNNSGLSGMPQRIATRGNKIYMTTSNGLVVYTDSTITTQLPESISENSGLTIFPNPAQDVVNLGFNLDAPSPVTFELINLHGQVVHSSGKTLFAKGSHNVQLNLGTLQDAIYFVKLKTDSGYRYSKLNVVKP